MRIYAAIYVLLGAYLAPCRAGDWRGRRPNALYDALPESELSYNEVQVPLLEQEAIPAAFDWCDDSRNMCTPSWNQHQPQYCGSCFLHGTLHMVQDRLKIAKGGQGPDVMLGRQSFLNCAPFHGMSGGCDGGEVIDVLRYMRHWGLPDEGCYSYNATDYTKYTGGKKINELGKKKQTCPDDGYCINCMPKTETGDPECWGVTAPIRYKVVSYAKIKTCGVQAMQSEIMQRGPITCSIAAPLTEFDFGYRKGVYDGPSVYDQTGSYENDHDVEIVGWGVDGETGLKYWRARNSWGTFWGEKGFFRLTLGVNKLNLEGRDEDHCDCWYAVPEFSMEDAVDAGKYGGSMYGLRKANAGEAGDEIIKKAMENLRAFSLTTRGERDSEDLPMDSPRRTMLN